MKFLDKKYFLVLKTFLGKMKFYFLVFFSKNFLGGKKREKNTFLSLEKISSIYFFPFY